MAGDSMGQGGNKLDAELNLVPFIDLLSTLVLFLLVTAVWLQVSAISASVDSKGKASTAQAEQKKLTIHVGAAGYRLSWPGALATRGLPLGLGREPEKLTALLKKALKAGQGGAQAPALPLTAVSADDDVPYGAVIQAVDAAKAAGLPAVALSTD